MNSKHLIWVYPAVLLVACLICFLRFIELRCLVAIVSVFSFIFLLLYAPIKINEENPSRFYRQHYNIGTKKSSRRFDFDLVKDIFQKAIFFGLVVFVIVSVVVFLSFDQWPFDVRYTMGIVGFDWIVLFVMVAKDSYNFVKDRCEEEENVSKLNEIVPE